jgi:hypothetical protein
MSIYITKEDLPGILFTKQDGRGVFAANQPRIFDGVEDSI